MKNEEKASISIMKIICVSIILVLISGIGVMAASTNLKDVKVVLTAITPIPEININIILTHMIFIIEIEAFSSFFINF